MKVRITIQPQRHANCARPPHLNRFKIRRMVVWGSDWPFVRLHERIERWLPDEADRRRVLREKPSRLFGFAFWHLSGLRHTARSYDPTDLAGTAP